MPAYERDARSADKASPVNKLTLHQSLRGRGDLKSVHRDVLQALASYGGYQLTSIKVSVERVCKDYDLSENTVRAAISHCRKCGYLQLVRPGVGRGNPSEYVIVIPPQNPPNFGEVYYGADDVKPPNLCTENPPNLDLKPPKVCAKTPQGLGTNQFFTSSSPVIRDQQASPPTAAHAPADASFKLSVQEFLSSSARDWKEWGAEYCPGVDIKAELRNFSDWYQQRRRSFTRGGWYTALHKWLEKPKAEAAKRIVEQAKRQVEPGNGCKLGLDYGSWDDEPAPTVNGGRAE